MSRYVLGYRYASVDYPYEDTEKEYFFTFVFEYSKGYAFVLDSETLECTLEKFATRSEALSLGEMGAHHWGLFCCLPVFKHPEVSFSVNGAGSFIIMVCGVAFYFSCSNPQALFLDGKELMSFDNVTFTNSFSFYVYLVCASGEGIYRISFWLGYVGFLTFWVDSAVGKLLCYAVGLDFDNGIHLYPGQDKGKYNRLLGRIAKADVFGGRVY